MQAPKSTKTSPNGDICERNGVPGSTDRMPKLCFKHILESNTREMMMHAHEMVFANGSPGHIYITSIAARGGGGSFKRLKLYNSEEHVPIESFVTTLIH